MTARIRVWRFMSLNAPLCSEREEGFLTLRGIELYEKSAAQI